MTTITVCSVQSGFEERGARVFDRQVVRQGGVIDRVTGTYVPGVGTPNRNRWGQWSWATGGLDGAALLYPELAFIQFGMRMNHYKDTNPVISPATGGYSWPNNFVVTFYPPEGVHEQGSYWYFRPPVPQGATIDSAYLSLYVQSFSDPVSSIAGSVFMRDASFGDHWWRIKIFGIAEDNVIPGRWPDCTSGYDVTHQAEFQPKFQAMRRYRFASSLLDRQHTVARVQWQWQFGAEPGGASTRWQSPDLSAVVQEIVSRPGWVSGNRLALWAGPEGMWNNLVAADMPFPRPPDAYGSGYPLFKGVTFCAFTPGIPASYLPQLTVTYH